MALLPQNVRVDQIVPWRATWQIEKPMRLALGGDEHIMQSRLNQLLAFKRLTLLACTAYFKTVWQLKRPRSNFISSLFTRVCTILKMPTIWQLLKTLTKFFGRLPTPCNLKLHKYIAIGRLISKKMIGLFCHSKRDWRLVWNLKEFLLQVYIIL